MYEPNDWVLRWTHKWWWGPSVFFWFLALSFFLIALILSAVFSSFPFWVVCLSLCVLSFVSFGSHSHLKSLFVFAEDTPWKFKLSLSSHFIFFSVFLSNWLFPISSLWYMCFLCFFSLRPNSIPLYSVKTRTSRAAEMKRNRKSFSKSEVARSGVGIFF